MFLLCYAPTNLTPTLIKHMLTISYVGKIYILYMIVRFWAREVANQDGCHRDRSSLFVWTTARYFYVCILSCCHGYF